MSFDAAGGVLPSGFTCTRASKAWYFDSTGTLQEAANDIPRFDYDPSTLALRGLLIEEQRTNSHLNPRCEGAVVGVPGTMPTNWATGFYAPGGLTRAVAGTGTEYGMRYVDLRIYGTATNNQENSGGTMVSGIAAAPSQQWAQSVYARVVAGSSSGVGSITMRLMALNSGLAYLSESGAPLTPDSTFRRYSSVITTPASAAFVYQTLSLFATGAGAVVDITIRLYAPQVELGAFPTSPILPPVGVPAASTRARDDIENNPIGSWYNPAAGTLVAQFGWYEGTRYTSGIAHYGAPISFVTGTTGADTIYIRGTNNNAGFSSNLGGVSQVNITDSGVDFRTQRKFAYAWALNDFAYTRDGNAVGGNVDTSATVPPVNRVYLGGTDGVSWKLNGHVLRLVYYRTRLTNTQLQALTT